MNKTQTKIDAERYVAPAMNEHVLMMKRHILDASGQLNNWNEVDVTGSWTTTE